MIGWKERGFRRIDEVRPLNADRPILSATKMYKHIRTVPYVRNSLASEEELDAECYSYHCIVILWVCNYTGRPMSFWSALLQCRVCAPLQHLQLLGPQSLQGAANNHKILNTLLCLRLKRKQSAKRQDKGHEEKSRNHNNIIIIIMIMNVIVPCRHRWRPTAHYIVYSCRNKWVLYKLCEKPEQNEGFWCVGESGSKYLDRRLRRRASRTGSVSSQQKLH